MWFSNVPSSSSSPSPYTSSVLSWLKRRMCSLCLADSRSTWVDDIAVRELEAAAEGVVDVRLGGEVHDGIDLLGLEHVLGEVGSANVSLDEFRGGPDGLSSDRGASSSLS